MAQVRVHLPTPQLRGVGCQIKEAHASRNTRPRNARTSQLHGSNCQIKELHVLRTSQLRGSRLGLNFCSAA